MQGKLTFRPLFIFYLFFYFISFGLKGGANGFSIQRIKHQLPYKDTFVTATMTYDHVTERKLGFDQ